MIVLGLVHVPQTFEDVGVERRLRAEGRVRAAVVDTEGVRRLCCWRRDACSGGVEARGLLVGECRSGRHAGCRGRLDATAGSRLGSVLVVEALERFIGVAGCLLGVGEMVEDLIR